MRDRLPAAITCLCVFVALPAHAQGVRREENPPGRISREGNAAEEPGRTDWPDVREGEPETRLRVNAYLGDVDATLVTAKSFGENKPLSEAKAVAVRAGLSNSDFIVGVGRKTMFVDMEFNDYLRRNGRLQSSVKLPLAALRDALREFGLIVDRFRSALRHCWEDVYLSHEVARESTSARAR